MRQHFRLAYSSVFAAIGLWVTMSAAAFGEVIAFDSASDPAYADGWQNTDQDEFSDNGGFGFQEWGIAYGSPNQIDTGTPEPDNQLGAPAFRLGPGTGTGGIARGFANPLQAGQSFQLDYDPFNFVGPEPSLYSRNEHWLSLGDRFAMYAYYEHFTNPNGTPSFSYGSTEWGLYVASAFDNLNGGAALPIDDGRRQTGFTVTESHQGLTINVELPTIDTYRLRIYDLSDVLQVDISGALGGTAGEEISSFFFYGGGGRNASTPTPAVYLNNLQILAPDPPEGIPGDYNDDGTVDAADYVMWRKLLPSGGTLQNDGTPGADAGDYDVWVENFGSAQTGSGGGSGAVPEPASIVLIVLGCCALSRRQRSR
jgi:hypothetical protein